MKRVVFFVVLFIVGFILLWETRAAPVEGFAEPVAQTPAGAAPTINVPEVKLGPAPLGISDAKPYAPPTTQLLAAPPGQAASVNSYPYVDPALKKTRAGRIQSVWESLQGFMTHEAKGLEALGDPAATLPMGVARSDARRLEDELNVLMRNPGLEPTLTEKDLDEVQANLAYLQKKWRMSPNMLQVEGYAGRVATGLPQGRISNTTEGYQDASVLGLDPTAGTTAPGSDPLASSFGTLASTAPSGSGGTTSGGTTSGGTTTGGTTTGGTTSGGTTSGGTTSGGTTSGGTTSGGTTTPTDPPATRAQLLDLKTKIAAQIAKNQASGSTDPFIVRQNSILSTIMTALDGILKNLSLALITEAEIPITQSEYTAFLQALPNPYSTLPDIIDSTGGKSGLNNLFNLYPAGDASGAVLDQALFNKYAEKVLNNTSWKLSLDYTSEAERTLAEEAINMFKTALAPENRVPATVADTTNAVSGPAPGTETAYRGMFDSIVRSLGLTNLLSNGSGASGTPVGGTGADGASLNGPTDGVPTDSGYGAPGKLDWKERSKQICQQIAKRGMNPVDYGCMTESTNVSDFFSYRGYAKMICSRLATHYDPGIPQLCGCPPPTWPGWRP